MHNHIQSVLAEWLPLREQHRWVLGVVTETQGSSYRKAGAMMLISELGQCLGLLSGGCLERALLAEAKRVLAFNRPRQITFDATQQADVAWQFGLGCGGRVTIRLYPLTPENDHMALAKVHASLLAGSALWLKLPLHNDMLQAEWTPFTFGDATPSAHVAGDRLWVPLQPQYRLVVFGAGVDVVPLARMVAALGWYLTLVDHRVGMTRPEDFPAGTEWLRLRADAPQVLSRLADAQAVMVMTHNIDLDASALQALRGMPLSYIGLLGPAHRKARVLASSGVAEHSLAVPIDGPMGIPLGGELPESVALSAVAQCHRALVMGRQSDGLCHSHVLQSTGQRA